MVGNEAYSPLLYHLETNRVFQVETPSIYYSCFSSTTGFFVAAFHTTDAIDKSMMTSNRTTGIAKCNHCKAIRSENFCK